MNENGQCQSSVNANINNSTTEKSINHDLNLSNAEDSLNNGFNLRNDDSDAMNQSTSLDNQSNQLANETSASSANNNDLSASKKKRVRIIEQKISFSKGIGTNLTSSDIDFLFKYYQDAVEERNALLLKISTLVIDLEFFNGNDNKTRFYTGLNTWSLLNHFFNLIKKYLPTHICCKLSPFRMVALTLMKLKLNLSFTDLGYRFQVDETTAATNFYRCICIMYKLFFNSKLLHWPERQILQQITPSYFRSTFKESVTIIVDCFEIFGEQARPLLAADQTFTQYEHATLKYLIGISTTGAIIFVSTAFDGRMSDKHVVTESGFLDKIQEDDVVLANKGFLTENEVEAKQASLKRPSFVLKGNQLLPTEVKSRYYPRIRIHVDRLTSVLREKFNICADVVTTSAISKRNELFDSDMYDKIILICSCLVNICPPVVGNSF